MKKSDLILKIKGYIYCYTGIYLAKKEELEYVTSKEFWKQFDKFYSKRKKHKLSSETIQSILIGLWQAKYKFYRSF